MAASSLDYTCVQFNCPHCHLDVSDVVLIWNTKKCAFTVDCPQCHRLSRIVLNTVACLICSYEKCHEVVTPIFDCVILN